MMANIHRHLHLSIHTFRIALPSIMSSSSRSSSRCKSRCIIARPLVTQYSSAAGCRSAKCARHIRTRWSISPFAAATAATTTLRPLLSPLLMIPLATTQEAAAAVSTAAATATTTTTTTTAMSTLPRVLSIQSHVVHGYAGNRCAVFPLQTLGFEVDFVNSVQFSNHTGYPVFKGSKVSAEELHELYEGLKLNKVVEYSHVLTGYVASVDFLRELSKIIKYVKQTNKNVMYVCDPVLGDEGAYYVPQELTQVYNELLLPLCDVLTPNQFELSELTGLPVKTESDAIKAIDVLHDRGVPLVVLTSAALKDHPDITCIASRKKDNSRIKFEIPWLSGRFVGTGDLFAATILAWISKEASLEKAICNALNTVQGVLRKTVECAEELKASRPELCPAALMELRLIQNRHMIVDPPVLLSGSKV